jgi:NAD(P)-dependent dehydrogenase (short-subunit alcohol dehydrogenase family)
MASEERARPADARGFLGVLAKNTLDRATTLLPRLSRVASADAELVRQMKVAEKMHNGSLRGRTAIVTGGGRGLGRAMALGLARAGANVVITAARNQHELDAVRQAAANEQAGAIHSMLADVVSEEDSLCVVDRTIREFGAIHILVNNAGRGMRFVSERFFDTPTRFWQTDPAVWRMIIDTNVNGPFLMARAVVPPMLKQQWGRLVNISMNHETMCRVGFSPYGPSKAALESETIIWAQDLAGTAITVNSLLPGGATDTGMVPEIVAGDDRRGLLDPQIMVPPLLWLVSEAAAQVTGARFVAKLWDSSLPPEKAAERARMMAGWSAPTP